MREPKIGQLVYRVSEGYAANGVDAGIVSRQIVRVTAQKIELDRPFPFTTRTSGLIDKDRVLHRVFFLTAKEALCAYVRAQGNEMARAAERLAICRANIAQVKALPITALEAPELLK